MAKTVSREYPPARFGALLKFVPQPKPEGEGDGGGYVPPVINITSIPNGKFLTKEAIEEMMTPGKLRVVADNTVAEDGKRSCSAAVVRQIRWDAHLG